MNIRAGLYEAQNAFRAGLYEARDAFLLHGFGLGYWRETNEISHPEGWFHVEKCEEGELVVNFGRQCLMFAHEPTFRKHHPLRKHTEQDA